MKKVPIENYIAIILISISIVGIVYLLMDRYRHEHSKIDFLTEVSEKDLSQFILEKNDVIIYFTKNTDKELSKDLEDYLLNNEVKNNIIYVDLNTVSKKFEKNFNKKFSPSTYYKIGNPTLMYIEDGKVAYYLTDIDNIKQIKTFIKEHVE